MNYVKDMYARFMAATEERKVLRFVVVGIAVLFVAGALRAAVGW